MKNNPV